MGQGAGGKEHGAWSKGHGAWSMEHPPVGGQVEYGARGIRQWADRWSREMEN